MVAAFIAFDDCFMLGSARVRGFVSAAEMHVCGANGLPGGVSLYAVVSFITFNYKRNAERVA